MSKIAVFFPTIVPNPELEVVAFPADATRGKTGLDFDNAPLLPPLVTLESVAATASGDRYVATVAGTGRGALFAVELIDPAGFGWRYPDVLQETPYRSLPP